MKTGGAEKFRDLTVRFFAAEDSFFPSLASHLGLHQWDSELDSFSAESLKKCEQSFSGFLAGLKEIDPEELSCQEQAEYQMLKAYLHTYLRALNQTRDWETDPSVYLETAIAAVYILLMREFAPLEQRLKSAIARLQQFPRLFSEGKKNLQNPPRVFTEVAIESIKCGEDFFTELLPSLAGQVPALKEQVLAASRVAHQAVQDYLNFLENDLLPRSQGEYAIGEELFNEILKEEHFLPYDCKQLWELGNHLVARTEQSLRQLAGELMPGKDWKEVMSILVAEHPSKEHLVQAYQEAVKKVKDFVIKKDLVAIPEGEELKLILTPAVFRSTIPFAAYLPPGPYEKIKLGEFWVTPVDETLPPDAQECQLKEHSYGKIEYTVLHESYPGHHLQLSWITNLKSEILKRISFNTVFVEGWAFYCEEMMKEQGYLGREGELCQLKDQLWRAIRVILDVGLHTSQITFAEAVKMLEERVGMAPNCARAEVKRYTRHASQPMSYFIGKLEILKLKELFKQKKPDLGLKEFHHLLLNSGSMPPALIPLYYSGRRNVY